MYRSSACQLILSVLAVLAGCWAPAVCAAEGPGFPLPARGVPCLGSALPLDVGEWNRDKTGTSGVPEKGRSPQVIACSVLTGGGSLVTEREGFEPPVRSPAHRISNAAPSATRTPLQSRSADTSGPACLAVYRELADECQAEG